MTQQKPPSKPLPPSLLRAYGRALILNRDKKIPWSKIPQQLSSEGLVNPSGKPFTSSSLRSQMSPKRRGQEVRDFVKAYYAELDKPVDQEVSGQPAGDPKPTVASQEEQKAHGVPPTGEPDKVSNAVKQQRASEEEILAQAYEIMKEKCLPKEREWHGRGKPREDKDAYKTVGVRLPKALNEDVRALKGKITTHVETALRLYLMVLNSIK